MKHPTPFNITVYHYVVYYDILGVLLAGVGGLILGDGLKLNLSYLVG